MWRVFRPGRGGPPGLLPPKEVPAREVLVVFWYISGWGGSEGQTWIGDQTNPRWRTSPFRGFSLIR